MQVIIVSLLLLLGCSQENIEIKIKNNSKKVFENFYVTACAGGKFRKFISKVNVNEELNFKIVRDCKGEVFIKTVDSQGLTTVKYNCKIYNKEKVFIELTESKIVCL